MCTVLLPPGVNPIAVNRYIIIYDYGGWPKHVGSLSLNKSTFCGLLCWYFIYYIVHYHVHNSPPLISIHSHTNPIKTPLFYLLRRILLLHSHLPIGPPSGFCPSGFPAMSLYQFIFSPARATCPAHLILLYLITLLSGEGPGIDPRWCHRWFFPWHPTIPCSRGRLSLLKWVPG
jgi:hypothetical protein